jgi:predicted dehydrogenase
MSVLKTAVIGVGHLGQHHARVYSSLPGCRLIGVVDPDAERAAEIAAKHGTETFVTHRDLIGQVDAVSIAAPTSNHHEIALDMLGAGVHVLVEKPITKTLAEADELVTAAGERGLKLAVGHIERFNPAVAAAVKHITNPRFIEADRISPFSFRSVDISVVHDLMIHDIDLILHFVDSDVAEVQALGVDILTTSEDIANARLVFENGCIAYAKASRVSMKQLRKIRLFQRDAYLSMDFVKKEAVLFRKSPDFDPSKVDIASMASGGIAELTKLVFSKFLTREVLPMDEEDQLEAELGDFVDAIQNDRQPAVTGEHGRRALATAERIVVAIAAHSWE